MGERRAEMGPCGVLQLIAATSLPSALFTRPRSPFSTWTAARCSIPSQAAHPYGDGLQQLAIGEGLGEPRFLEKQVVAVVIINS